MNTSEVLRLRKKGLAVAEIAKRIGEDEAAVWKVLGNAHRQAAAVAKMDASGWALGVKDRADRYLKKWSWQS